MKNRQHSAASLREDPHRKPRFMQRVQISDLTKTSSGWAWKSGHSSFHSDTNSAVQMWTHSSGLPRPPFGAGKHWGFAVCGLEFGLGIGCLGVSLDGLDFFGFAFVGCFKHEFTPKMLLRKESFLVMYYREREEKMKREQSLPGLCLPACSWTSSTNSHSYGLCTVCLRWQ